MTSHLNLPGVDPDEGIRRAGQCEALYFRFLRRFAEDETFWVLGRALEENDVSAAFLYAHTLKGLCAQLAVNGLLAPIGELCELLRPQQPSTLPEARRLYAQLLPAFEETVRAFRALP